MSDAQAVGLFGGLFLIVWLFIIVLCAFMMFCTYKLFQKAGYAGWKALIPFYNTYIMTQMSVGNGLLFLLMFVPIVNVVFGFYLGIKFTNAFGVGVLGFIAYLFAPLIMLPIMAFSSKYEYVGNFPGYDL